MVPFPVSGAEMDEPVPATMAAEPVAGKRNSYLTPLCDPERLTTEPVPGL